MTRYRQFYGCVIILAGIGLGFLLGMLIALALLLYERW